MKPVFWSPRAKVRFFIEENAPNNAWSPNGHRLVTKHKFGKHTEGEVKQNGAPETIRTSDHSLRSANPLISKHSAIHRNTLEPAFYLESNRVSSC